MARSVKMLKSSNNYLANNLEYAEVGRNYLPSFHFGTFRQLLKSRLAYIPCHWMGHIVDGSL